MSAMMSIYQGDGTRNDVPSVFIGVDEDRSDRLRVAFGIPCKTMASFECSAKGARELAQWLFDTWGQSLGVYTFFAMDLLAEYCEQYVAS